MYTDAAYHCPYIVLSLRGIQNRHTSICAVSGLSPAMLQEWVGFDGTKLHFTPTDRGQPHLRHLLHACHKCNKYCRGLLSFSMWFYGCTRCSVHPLSPLQGDPPSTEDVFNGQCEVRPASHCEAVHFAWGSFLIADTSRQQRTNGKFFWPPVFPQADSSACYWGLRCVVSCIY